MKAGFDFAKWGNKLTKINSNCIVYAIQETTFETKHYLSEQSFD